jgi:hypothetical protein
MTRTPFTLAAGLALAALTACGASSTNASAPDAALARDAEDTGGAAGAGGALPGGTDAAAPQPGGTPTGGAPSPDEMPDASPTSTDADAGAPLEDAGPPPPDPRADTLIGEAAAAICDALFRCCESTSLNAYFDAYAHNERLAEFADRLPPQATPTPESCPGLVEGMLTVVPLGAWTDAVRAGRARIVPERADACVAALRGAACGGALAAALYDPTCFWLGAPVGGDQQRTVFERFQSTGDTCAPLTDGFGGLFYGTCNPNTDYCCFGEGDDCGFPEEAGGVGLCRPAGDVGDDCSQVPVHLCRTGLDCGDDNRCHAPATTPLAAGDPCVDASFNLLGLCVDTYCDFFESRTCLPRKSDGEPCSGPEECVALSCVDGLCAPSTFCVGP